MSHSLVVWGSQIYEDGCNCSNLVHDYYTIQRYVGVYVNWQDSCFQRTDVAVLKLNNVPVLLTEDLSI